MVFGVYLVLGIVSEDPYMLAWAALGILGSLFLVSLLVSTPSDPHHQQQSQPLSQVLSFLLWYRRLYIVDATRDKMLAWNPISRFYRYAFEERNPLIKYLYLVLVDGGYIVFMFTCDPYLPEDTRPYHRVAAFAVVLSLFVVYMKLANSDPGYIDESNHEQFLNAYKYDRILFYPGIICSTCKHTKPARSKHCRMCNRCIGRFDHHCVWLNNCIGANNHRLFLLYLFLQLLFLVYAMYLITQAVLTIGETSSHVKLVHSMVAPAGTIHPNAAVVTGGELVSLGAPRAAPSRKSLVFAVPMVAANHPAVFIMALLVICATPVVAGFCIMHLSIALTNATTNELGKRKGLRRVNYDSLRRTREAEVENPMKNMDLEVGCTPSIGGETQPTSTQDLAETELVRRERGSPTPSLTDLNWFEGGRRVPTNKEALAASYINRYDRGYMENFKEVMFPMHWRQKE